MASDGARASNSAADCISAGSVGPTGPLGGPLGPVDNALAGHCAVQPASNRPWGSNEWPGNYKQTLLPLGNELVYSVPSVAGASRQMTVHLPLPQTGMTVEAGNDAIEFLTMVIKRVRRELAKLEATREE